MCAKSAHVRNLRTCEHARFGSASHDEVYFIDENPRRSAYRAQRATRRSPSTANSYRRPRDALLRNNNPLGQGPRPTIVSLTALNPAYSVSVDLQNCAVVFHAWRSALRSALIGGL